MKSQMKRKIFGLTPRELVNICNEKLLCAARDLAEFTKNGINANFIVALAHKCEVYESTIEKSSTVPSASESLKIEEEIKDSLGAICEMGRRIWSDNPVKYQDYLVSISRKKFPEPGSAK